MSKFSYETTVEFQRPSVANASPYPSPSRVLSRFASFHALFCGVRLLLFLGHHKAVLSCGSFSFVGLMLVSAASCPSLYSGPHLQKACFV